MKSVFVSSTFRDMNFERDILNRAVSPRLNHILSKYNQSLRILDLRWGVDTSDLSEKEASDRVLSVCFDAIDECKPYFIILLGDRYGYTPEDNEYSVTHMEILRGAIENANRDNVFVYFREADYSGMPAEKISIYKEQNTAARNKLESLKQQLKAQMPDRCRKYKAKWNPEKQCLYSESFEELLYNDLRSLFVKTFASSFYLSPLHKQISENENTLNENIKYAYRSEELLNSILDETEHSKLPFGIIGDGGTGKSVLLSLLCSTLRSRGHQADILFCGDNSFSSSSRNAAEYTLYILTVAAGEKYDFAAFAKCNYRTLLDHIIEQRDKVQKKSYLLLDALDKCDENMLHFLLWCNRFLANQLTIVFSSRMTQQIESNKNSFYLSPLMYSKSDLLIMTDKILKKHGKAINKSIAETVCNKAETALHLELLLLRLLTLSTNDFNAIQAKGGNMNAINAHLENIINKSPDSIHQLIFDYLLAQLNACNDPETACFWISYITFSFNGLSDTDIQSLTDISEKKWILLDYTDFLSKLRFFIRTRENGKIDLSHDIIRETICDVFDSAKKEICKNLAIHFMSANDIENIQIESFIDAVYNSDSKRILLDFIQKHNDIILANEGILHTKSLKLRNAIFQLLRSGHGDFLINCAEECTDAEEIITLQHLISTSLLVCNDFLQENETLNIASVSMILPSSIPTFPAVFTEMTLRCCEKFFRKNHIEENEEIKNFLRSCYQILSQRRIEEGLEAETESEKTDSADTFINLLKNSDKENQNLFFAFEDLLVKYQKQAEKADTAQKAEDQLLKLLQITQDNQLNFDLTNNDVSLAGIYSYLGAACKTQKKWEKAVEYNNKSLDIYRKLYEQDTENIHFRKYRERVYNVANVLEAWAIAEKDNFAIWKKTKDAYAQAYELFLLAAGENISEEDMLNIISTIFSYGSALIMTKNYREGLDKYDEGIRFATELTERHPNNILQLRVFSNLLNCTYNTIQHKLFDAADEITSKICSYAGKIIESNNAFISNELLHRILEFSGGFKTLLLERKDENDKELELHIFPLLCKLYISILPIANDDIKINLICSYCFTGDILLFHKKDYTGALKEYQTLLNLLQKHNLIDFGKNEAYTDAAIKKLTGTYSNSLYALKQLDKKDKIEQLLGYILSWAEKIADYTASEKVNALQILFLVSAALQQLDSPLGTLLFTQTLNEMRKPKYTDAKYQDTVKMITVYMMNLLGGNIQ